MKYKGFKIYKYTTSDWHAVLLEYDWLSGEDKVVYRCKSIEKAKAWIDKNCKGDKNYVGNYSSI